VNTETTEPRDEDGPISGQRSTIQVLADLADQHPTLPASFTTIHTPGHGSPARLDMQLDTPTGFEQWRTALHIPAGAVTLHYCGTRSWISAETERHGTAIRLSAHGIVLTEQQVTAPRDASETAPAVTA